MEETDEALVAAWRDGDKRAGSRLFSRHFEPIARFFYSKVQTGVEDLVQRTFLALVERSEHLPAGVPVRAYLFGIARNLLLRRFRDQYRDGIFDGDTVSVADLGESPSALVDRREHLQLLYHALRSLPLELQIVVELFYWESYPAPAIAAALELPEGTVRTRLRRARQLLGDRLRALAPAPGLAEATLHDLERWARELRDQLGRG
ncbi:RNA polymerase sigma-70 factor, ECF subfamily [Nannocystis exedens]|uniref:RNA polymerase sigma-70 factor, ECF subfamily n=1 Tax=Nannocystis exedens TaxID=54 RepID=A0A1I1V5R9_9BACT|nr:sigma-70 family RNA polymerase sigma factor [Nannocystis exedens]PCC72370.1 RNA polymerase sigma 70 [Nannocystis exedens]SFD78392.1 RNA polymerase sigma-70 factor, ECF subfamily [Nannocystis exedens]